MEYLPGSIWYCSHDGLAVYTSYLASGHTMPRWSLFHMIFYNHPFEYSRHTRKPPPYGVNSTGKYSPIPDLDTMKKYLLNS